MFDMVHSSLVSFTVVTALQGSGDRTSKPSQISERNLPLPYQERSKAELCASVPLADQRGEFQGPSLQLGSSGSSS